MADYIYDAQGLPKGFRLGAFIYALDGSAIGRVWAEKAYRLDGTYVGAVVKNMVVDKPSVSRRNMPPVADPGPARPPAGGAESRRPVGDNVIDVFHLLLEPARVAADPPEQGWT
jgi:hypothetical protein